MLIDACQKLEREMSRVDMLTYRKTTIHVHCRLTTQYTQQQWAYIALGKPSYWNDSGSADISPACVQELTRMNFLFEIT